MPEGEKKGGEKTTRVLALVGPGDADAAALLEVIDCGDVSEQPTI